MKAIISVEDWGERRKRDRWVCNININLPKSKPTIIIVVLVNSRQHAAGDANLQDLK
jgi:hypothetical protein